MKMEEKAERNASNTRVSEKTKCFQNQNASEKRTRKEFSITRKSISGKLPTSLKLG